MDDLRNNRRFWEVMAGLLLLILGFAAVGSQPLVPMLFVLAGFYLLARQFDASRRSLAPPAEFERERDLNETPRDRQPGAEQVYSHAIRAVRRAGLDPAETQVLPVDVGVMAFRADRPTTVYRSQPVLDDVDYIQPFVQLRLPTRAVGRIRFEIMDSDGQTLFIHEDYHQLERGRNLVSPGARLAIHDEQPMDTAWTLNVIADGVLLATHQFAWQESTEKTVRRHISEDGEITNELRALMQDSQPGDLSLDDLLAAQEEAEQQQRQQR